MINLSAEDGQFESVSHRDNGHLKRELCLCLWSDEQGAR